jgi:hypothetical protein
VLSSNAPLARSLADREDELLRFAVEGGAASTTKWQPSFFDRRAERVVDAARRDLERITAEHAQRREALLRHWAVAPIEPVLAIVVR